MAEYGPAGRLSTGVMLGDAFGLVRTRFPAVAIWCAIYFVASFGMGLLLAPFQQAQLTALQGGAVSPTAFLGPMFLAQALLLVVFVALYAAAFRAVLFPEASRGFYLRLGGDELRLVGLMLILFVAGLIAMIAVGLVVAMLFAALGLGFGAAARTGGPSGGALIGAGLAGFLIFLALFCAFLFVWTRLSLAGPLTLVRRRIAIREGWRLSRGHFWSLFAGYLVIGVLLFLAMAAVSALVGGGAFMAATQARSDPAAMQQLVASQQAARFGALGIAGAVVMAFVGGIGVALGAGAMASATRQLLPPSEDVFA